MPRTSLVEDVAGRLLDRIVSGEFVGGSLLPSESELAGQFGVSRLTMREAVKMLAAGQVVRSVQGVGTFVAPVGRWTSVGAVIRVSEGDASQVIGRLVEVRGMLEVGAAELFAPLAAPADLETLADNVAAMRFAHREDDVESFVAADLAFHTRIIEGCGNPFVRVAFAPVAESLVYSQRLTAAVHDIREHAIVHHAAILAALHTGRASTTATAMREHLIQTRDDARRYLSGVGKSAVSAAGLTSDVSSSLNHPDGDDVTDHDAARTKDELLRDMPPPRSVTAEEIRASRAQRPRRTLVVLDDDPTGTQSVADLPVLTRWDTEDLAWALRTGADAVYVLTNSRSLDAADAERVNREVARNALDAAALLDVEIDFVSRSDSTLRGHYPLEPDTLVAALEEARAQVDAVVLVPAFGDAGRVTVRSVHYAGSEADGYVPASETEFARDATFGYAASDLREWVQEKTAGRIAASDVATVPLDILRSGHEAVTDILLGLHDARPVVVDIVEETDLRVLSLALLAAEDAGKRFLFRVGPPFVRGFIGQDVLEPLSNSDVDQIIAGGEGDGSSYGLVVVGSHVGLTTRQLKRLLEEQDPTVMTIAVEKVLGPDREAHLDRIVRETVEGLSSGNVVVTTSRELVVGENADDSLDIARQVSSAVVEVVRQVLEAAPPRFVVAKGGITSAEVASRGLSIARAMVRGPMLPGIVSLWEPTDGPAQGIPYVVFAGNVGDDSSLAEVVATLTA
ncbi:four-carbon acid sugar kinase family protein [Phycicoccus flavus]|uniref:FCD domain-containing protein n=1 Tax=Phycicoccus flavus TaxID=2502783 RepID=A0A8T6R3P8_9MICO|nr:four-carbon acid sugar kinase family protein [Phycicoccus flavus]NHA68597.1 FCD domain-containing protein [Phycicoccus flavus]NHA68704.1 FCD domain-containing protein [Phycicoccus flavus]